ncbi:MAG: hypothetical protein Q4G25_11980 [Paracoccus sp. (in: a-proteobacteria)]|nr:hypothetical protein [Paracoccus sp. (in: a-proteobacteria)]
MTSHFLPPGAGLTTEAIEKLSRLAAMIEIAGPGQPLVIRHGECCIRLDPDGTISVSGKQIIHDAERNIALRAGWIDLN